MAELNRLNLLAQGKYQSQSHARVPTTLFQKPEDENIIARESRNSTYEANDSGTCFMSSLSSNSEYYNRTERIKQRYNTNRVRESSFSKEAMKPKIMAKPKQVRQGKRSHKTHAIVFTQSMPSTLKVPPLQ